MNFPPPVDLQPMTTRRAITWVLRIAGAFFVANLIADRRGFTLVDPYFFIPFCCLAATIVGPLIAATRRSLPAAVLQACAIPAIILLFSLTLLNLAAPRGIWIFPPWQLVLEAAMASLTVTTAAAALSYFLLRRISPRIVTWGFRTATLAVVLAYRWWPAGIQ